MAISSITPTKQNKLPVLGCQVELERTSGSDGGSPAVAVSDEGQGAGLKSCPLSMTNWGGGEAPPSLLGNKVITARYDYATTERRQQKRAYHRIMSGLEVAQSKGQRIRFLTLTSPRDSTPETLSQHFRALKERIKRITPYKLAKGGWVPFGKLHSYYPGKGILERLEFRYIAIKTAEGSGGGVLHILFAGDYLPRQWLSEAWLDLHGAWNVDIRLGYGKRGLANYAVAQYCSGQSLFVRYSWSWSWVWKGFVKDWQYIKWCWRNARAGRAEWGGTHLISGHNAERLWVTGWAGGKCWDLSFASLLDKWRWHLQAGIPP
ncbi:hypothetical protein ES708_26708 [subsurface metagenome]